MSTPLVQIPLLTPQVLAQNPQRTEINRLWQQQSLAIAQEIKDRRNEGTALSNLGAGTR